MEPDNRARHSFARMFGGVAGAMDMGATKTYAPGSNVMVPQQQSTKYLNQAKELLSQPINVSEPRVRRYENIQGTVTNVPQENPMDINKYIGKAPEKKVVTKEPDQLTILKKALEPINIQLEKLCVLIGLVYQAVSNQEPVIPRQQAEDQGLDDIDETEEEDIDVDEEIKHLEGQLKLRPKPPTPEQPKETEVMDIDNVE